MLNALIILYILLFAFIAWRRFDLGLFFIFLLLPTYLIRFNIAGLPSTLLEIMILIVFITFLLKIFLSKNLRPYALYLKSITKSHYSLFLASGLFLLATTISVFTSIDTRSALGEWKSFYIEPFLLFIVLILHLKEKKQGELRSKRECPGVQIDNILTALILGGLATSLLAIYQHFTGWMVPWEYWENRETFRVTGWYGFPNGVGLFLAPLFPLALYLIKEKIKVINNKQLAISNYFKLICSLLFVPCSLLAIFFAKSTGGLVGAAAGIGLLLIFWKRTRWTAIILGTICFVGILGLNDSNPIKQELLMQDRSGQIRLNMWAETMEFLGDRPIAGAGLASYKTLIYPYRIDKWIEVFHHPHNIFLTMWVNLGIIGFFSFILILIWFYKIGFHAVKSYKLKVKSFELFLLASMTALMTTGLVDSPYIKNDLAILFWLLPALMIATVEINEEK